MHEDTLQANWMKNRLCLLFIFGLLTLIFPSQSYSIQNLDSLKTSINSVQNEDERLFSIEESLPGFIRNRDDILLDYSFSTAIELATNLKRDSSLAFIFLHQGIDQYYYGNYNEAKMYFQLAIEKYLTIPESIKTNRLHVNEANSYNNLGIINKKQGLYLVSLQNYQIALSIRNDLGDSVLIANTYLNIGNLYNRLRDIDKSKEYYLKARNTYLQLGNDFGLATANHNLGLVHELLDEYDEALKAYHESYIVYLRLDRVKSMGISLNNIGNIYIILENYDSAKVYLDDALSLYEELKDTVGISTVLLNLGNYHSSLGENEMAEKCYFQSLDISKSQGLKEKEVDVTRSLANHFKLKNDYKQAYYYLALVDDLELAFKSDEDTERFQRMDEHYREETNKKNMAIKELELQNSKNSLKDSKKFSLVLGAGIIIIFLLLTIQFIRYKTTNAIKKELESANNELKRINKEYEQTLISKEEKEMLLREIHHRVKNNLQIIMSLLRFQAMKGSSESKELILELQTRITAMSLLHEQLYMNDDFTKINVSDYIELLLNNLSSAYAKSYTINIAQKIEVENLDLDTLHPLGLLINEIVSNSLKHAFHDDFDQCNIYVNLYKKENVCYLEIGDNGIGFNKELILEAHNNLGIELIESLSKQLESNMETIIENGTHYKITFKLNNNRSRI